MSRKKNISPTSHSDAKVEKPDKAALRAGLLLGILTFLLYWPTLSYDFISFDDPQYVTGNSGVTSGITWSNLYWAFTSAHAANWHPLTWISHMLDCELYKLNPSGHHLTNILFHAANSTLALLLLHRMTGALWRSIAVAAFFAWHPLRVESVAWISERKDVLSGFFFFLTLLAYTAYVERKKTSDPPTWSTGCKDPFFLLAVGLYSLGLMSKPMLVTLPFILLLTDCWPLNRTRTDSPGWPKRLFPLAIEKWPMFMLSAASCIITYCSQKAYGATEAGANLDFWSRIQNAMVSYCRYFVKTFWPSDLTINYPYPAEGWHPLLVLGSTFCLALLTTGCILTLRKRPHLLIGWLWYLGMLVPVIGLVQVGLQPMADRYTYIATIGLSLAVAWSAKNKCTKGNHTVVGRILWIITPTALFACVALTRIQMDHWKNGVSLFRHAKSLSPLYYANSYYLGVAYRIQNQHQQALVEFDESLKLSPGNTFILCNKALSLTALERYSEAEETYHAAIRLDPRQDLAYFGLGQLYVKRMQYGPAETNFLRYLELFPSDNNTRIVLACLLDKAGKYREATEQFRIILQSDPKSGANRVLLAKSMRSMGNLDGAEVELRKVLSQQPDWDVIHSELAILLAEQGKIDEAIVHFQTALQLEPDNPNHRFNRDAALDRRKNIPVSGKSN
jgi:protein O-mannosyl-transferase